MMLALIHEEAERPKHFSTHRGHEILSGAHSRPAMAGILVSVERAPLLLVKYVVNHLRGVCTLASSAVNTAGRPAS
jgi:hypothetical protein